MARKKPVALESLGYMASSLIRHADLSQKAILCDT